MQRIALTGWVIATCLSCVSRGSEQTSGDSRDPSAIGFGTTQSGEGATASPEVESADSMILSGQGGAASLSSYTVNLNASNRGSIGPGGLLLTFGSVLPFHAKYPGNRQLVENLFGILAEGRAEAGQAEFLYFDPCDIRTGNDALAYCEVDSTSGVQEALERIEQYGTLAFGALDPASMDRYTAVIVDSCELTLLGGDSPTAAQLLARSTIDEYLAGGGRVLLLAANSCGGGETLRNANRIAEPLGVTYLYFDLFRFFSSSADPDSGRGPYLKIAEADRTGILREVESLDIRRLQPQAVFSEHAEVLLEGPSGVLVAAVHPH